MEILTTGCGFDTATRLVKKKKEENFILKLFMSFYMFKFYILYCIYFLSFLFSLEHILTQIICAQVFYIISKIVGILGP